MGAQAVDLTCKEDLQSINVDTDPDTDVESHLSAPNLLIVDDDEVALERLEHIAAQDGYTVYKATSGAQALELLGEQPISLVLTDVVMPGMSGKTLCRKLRATPWPSYMYTIMLSASDEAEDIVAALDAGADDFVSKFASRSELLARLRAGRRVVELDLALRHQIAEADKLCHVDRLTHCFNQHHLTPALEQEIARSRQHDHPLSVLTCDVEHFRDINKFHSHAVGDEVLQQIAQRMSSATGDYAAWVARFGADRFVLVMPETTLEKARNHAAGLAAGLLSDPIRCSAGLLPLTMRIGVTGVEPAKLQLPICAELLLHAADACLRVAKTPGGNLVIARAYRPKNTAACRTAGAPH